MADISKITLPDNSEYDLKDGYARENKADKVSSATNGNFAGLDSNGNLTDSGKKASDFIAASEKGTASGVATLTSSSIITSSQLPEFIRKNNARVFYGTCTALADSSIKSVTLASSASLVDLKTGDVTFVKFTYKNNVMSPKLAVGSTSLKNIKVDGADAKPGAWKAGAVVAFVYDGTYYHMVNERYATTSEYGTVKLSSETSSSSEELAATPKAVKTAYDLASAKISSSLKGAANGVAELDSNGKVPSSQLPSYVDDIIEGYYYDGKFYEESSHTTEITGETGKIYVDLSTEKTYRWSGTAFVEISASLALGETSSTAYRGDHGKTAYDHATDSSRLTTAQTSGLYKFATTAEGHVASTTAVQQSDITSLGIAPAINGTWYGECSTAAATQQKEVTINGITSLTPGLNIRVKFTNAQSYNGAPTLKLNSFDAATINCYTDGNALQYEWRAGEIIDFVYDGTNWVELNGGRASTSYYGYTKLSSSIVSTSEGVAATPNAVSNAMWTVASNFAEKFKSTNVYPEGSYCTLNGLLYCRNSWGGSTPVAEAWDESKWTRVDPIQQQIDGKVSGPSSSTDAHIAVFDGTTGKAIKDGTYTIGKSVPSDAVFTDEATEQIGSSTENWRKVLLKNTYQTTSTGTGTDETGATYYANNISVQPSTGTLRATAYNVADQCTIQYDSTNQSIKFVFA